MSRQSKTEVSSREIHETKTTSFRASLNITRKEGHVKGTVSITKLPLNMSAFVCDNLGMDADDLPELIKELQWIHARWQDSQP